MTGMVAVDGMIRVDVTVHVVTWVDVDGTMGVDVVVAVWVALAAVCKESGSDECSDIIVNGTRIKHFM